MGAEHLEDLYESVRRELTTDPHYDFYHFALGSEKLSRNKATECNCGAKKNNKKNPAGGASVVN